MKLKFNLLPTVLAVVGALVVISAGSIMLLNRYTVDKTVSHLASRVVASNLNGLELALRGHLDAAANQAQFIAESIRSGAVNFDEQPKLIEFAAGSMAAAPEVHDVVVGSSDGIALRVERSNDGTISRQWFVLARDDQFQHLGQETRGHKNGYWAPPLYRAGLGETLLMYTLPIWQGDDYLGFVFVGLSTEQLSRFALRLSNPPRSTVFVLRGDHDVLAHMYLAIKSAKLSREKPLLTTHEIIDPVMGRLEYAKPFRMAGFKPPKGTDVLDLEALGTRYLVIAKEITGYGNQPLLLGSYSEAAVVTHWLATIQYATLIGLALIAISLAAAFAASRMITGPIRETSKGVADIASLEFEKVAPLKESRIKELDDLANSFNAMLVGLKSFGRYVPRTLVTRLIRDKRVGAGTEERTLTVMFTDMADFTTTCEGLDVAQVAEFINHHLEIVGACIEREEGTIDKYIGDAVLAFWGAPDRIDDAPMRACRAALAIRDALAEDNRKRIAEGLAPVRVRIGIHTGPLIVGDIGSPNRLNYTVVGDVVNAAERLEGLGKEIDPNAESVVLVSRSTKDDLDERFELVETGRYHVKGKQEEIEVFQLVGQR